SPPTAPLSLGRSIVSRGVVALLVLGAVVAVHVAPPRVPRRTTGASRVLSSARVAGRRCLEVFVCCPPRDRVASRIRRRRHVPCCHVLRCGTGLSAVPGQAATRPANLNDRAGPNGSEDGRGSRRPAAYSMSQPGLGSRS